MSPIFPPHGPRDEARWRSNSADEQSYSLFCLEFCSDILSRRPEQYEALEAAANHYTQLGYYADGLGLDERLVRMRPDDPGVLYNIACSFALTAHNEEAITALTQAVCQGYTNHRHAAKDGDLATLRGDPRFQQLLSAMRQERE